MEHSSLQRLSKDLLQSVLDQIEPNPDKTLPIDRRQFLSFESFEQSPSSSRDSIRDIGRFRSVCREFAKLGAPVLFTRVTARFSKGGLERLDQLAGWPHLAQHVKKFSYMLPYFYQKGSQEMVLTPPVAGATLPEIDVINLRQKVEEQQAILNSKEDVRVLKRAIASFTSLQFVRLLRVADKEDQALLTYIRNHEDLRASLVLDWVSACSRGSWTIGAALLHSNVPWSRFSSPMLSPQSAEFLALQKPRSLPALAARLTCLHLHFDDGNDLDQQMSELSGLFETVFNTAINMQNVHVGFPTHRPLSLHLEEIFHNVKWEKLVAFGIQGWRLEADEILHMALRHREKLKGLRLRDVILNEGSMWKDLLSTLRDNLPRLEWVSLRGIGYIRHFNDERQAAGAEVPDDPPPGDSDSESDDDDDDPMVGPVNYHQQANGAPPSMVNGRDGDDDDSHDDDSAANTNSDDEHGPEENEMEFPTALNQPDTPASAPWCNCNGRSYASTADELEDDGYFVSTVKRKAWEKWVVRRCPEHSDR